MRVKIVLLMILTALAGFARAGDKLSSLQVGSQVFSNVTITKVDATDIFFTHSAGMANVKIKNLSPELQKQFNFDSQKAKVEELKQAGNKTNYHNELLRQPAPKVEDAAGARMPVAAGIYGEVSEQYVSATVTRTGDVSPLTSIRTIDGQNLDFRGHPVVINLFATWCGPCREEMPYIEKYLWQGFKGQGLIVIAVGRSHKKEEVAAFQKQSGFTFYFAEDPKLEIYGKFATRYIPRCILIGKDGRIKCQTVGFSPADFRKLIVGATVETGKTAPK